MSLPVVGVMGSGTDEHAERAEALGEWLAARGVHLLTGGGRGVMAAVSRGFCRHEPRRGLVLGVLPSQEGGVEPKDGYPNPWVEIPIRTHLPLSGDQGTHELSRNHINVLTSDLIIALPGGRGTASEAELAQRYGKPIVAYLDARDDIDGLPADIPVVSSLAEVRSFVEGQLAG